MGHWELPFRMGMLGVDGFLTEMEKDGGLRHVLGQVLQLSLGRVLLSLTTLFIVARPSKIVATIQFFCRRVLF